MGRTQAGLRNIFLNFIALTEYWKKFIVFLLQIASQANTCIGFRRKYYFALEDLFSEEAKKLRGSGHVSNAEGPNLVTMSYESGDRRGIHEGSTQASVNQPSSSWIMQNDGQRATVSNPIELEEDENIISSQNSNSVVSITYIQDDVKIAVFLGCVFLSVFLMVFVFLLSF